LVTKSSGLTEKEEEEEGARGENGGLTEKEDEEV